MNKICVCGAAGRMGRRIIACAAEMDELTISGAAECNGHPCLGQDAGILAGIPATGVILTDSLQDAIRDADVVIDFALATGVPERANVYAEAGTALVMGTTAIEESGLQALTEAAESIAVLHAPNFSIGVNLLFALVRQAAGALDERYDAEVIEMHHRRKKDAPSGTAVQLVEMIEEGRDVERGSSIVYGRQGITGERPAGEIGVHAVRGGDVAGEHIIIFATEGERIELIHKASNRDTFARGALKAALYLTGKQAGMYSMNDVLGFTRETT